MFYFVLKSKFLYLTSEYFSNQQKFISTNKLRKCQLNRMCGVCILMLLSFNDLKAQQVI